MIGRNPPRATGPRQWSGPSDKVKRQRTAARIANRINTAYIAHLTLDLPDYSK